MLLGEDETSAFLARETAHRLGKSGNLRWRFTDNSLKGALAVSSPGTVQWLQGTQQTVCPNIGRLTTRPATRKGLQALEEAQTAGLDFNALIDMQDARN